MHSGLGHCHCRHPTLPTPRTADPPAHCPLRPPSGCCVQEKLGNAKDQAGDAMQGMKERATDALHSVQVGKAAPGLAAPCSIPCSTPTAVATCAVPDHIAAAHASRQQHRTSLTAPHHPLLPRCRTVLPTWLSAPRRLARTLPTALRTRWTRLPTRCASEQLAQA